MNPSHLLLDTHIWLWFALGLRTRLGASSIKLIEQSESIQVSIISVWEIALLENKGRVVLPLPISEWISQALAPPTVQLVGLEHPLVVIDSCRLPGRFHADPADRFLVATARATGATLMTRDEKIIEYGTQGHVKVMAA